MFLFCLLIFLQTINSSIISNVDISKLCSVNFVSKFINISCNHKIINDNLNIIIPSNQTSNFKKMKSKMLFCDKDFNRDRLIFMSCLSKILSFFGNYKLFMQSNSYISYSYLLPLPIISSYRHNISKKDILNPLFIGLFDIQLLYGKLAINYNMSNRFIIQRDTMFTVNSLYSKSNVFVDSIAFMTNHMFNISFSMIIYSSMRSNISNIDIQYNASIPSIYQHLFLNKPYFSINQVNQTAHVYFYSILNATKLNSSFMFTLPVTYYNDNVQYRVYLRLQKASVYTLSKQKQLSFKHRLCVNELFCESYHGHYLSNDDHIYLYLNSSMYSHMVIYSTGYKYNLGYNLLPIYLNTTETVLNPNYNITLGHNSISLLSFYPSQFVNKYNYKYVSFRFQLVQNISNSDYTTIDLLLLSQLTSIAPTLSIKFNKLINLSELFKYDLFNENAEQYRVFKAEIILFLSIIIIYILSILANCFTNSDGPVSISNSSNELMENKDLLIDYLSSAEDEVDCNNEMFIIE